MSAKLRMLPILLVAVVAAGLVVPEGAVAMSHEKMATKTFTGAKVNAGTASFHREGGKMMLTLSDDFAVPETPDPHWQVVDSKGNTYLLNRLMIKDDKFNKTITLPQYIPDVAEVQIWCAWAEALLGEAAFETPMK